MTIEHIIGIFSPEHGGPVVSLTNYAQGQAKAGVNVRIRTIEGYPDTSSAVRLPPPIDEKVFNLAWPAKLGRSPALKACLHNELSPDIYHLHGAWLRAMYYGFLEARRRCRPFLVQINGSYQPYDLQRKPWRKRIARIWFQDRIFASADCLHVNSTREAEQIKALGFDKPMVIIPAGFDTIEADAWIARLANVQIWSEIPAKTFFLYLARIHPNKGIDLLLHAWQRLEKRYPETKLLVVGTGEPRYIKWFLDLMADLKLSNRCIWRGFVNESEKAWCYLNAKFYCLPSHTENFGNTVQEALGFYTPVVTTTETPWGFIPQEGCGWIAECSVGAIAEQLDDALSKDFTELKAMGALGRKLIDRDYSLKSVVRNQIRTYDWLLGGAAPDDILHFGNRH